MCLHGCVLQRWEKQDISPSPCACSERTGDTAVCSHRGMVQPTPTAAASIKTPSPRAGDAACWPDKGGRLRLRVTAIRRYSSTVWHVQVLFLVFFCLFFLLDLPNLAKQMQDPYSCSKIPSQSCSASFGWLGALSC